MFGNLHSRESASKFTGGYFVLQKPIDSSGLCRDYKMPDGKPANMFGYDNQPQNRGSAQKVIEETHDFYRELMSGQLQNIGGLALN